MELELQTVVSYTRRVLRTKVGSSASAPRALNHGAISWAPDSIFISQHNRDFGPPDDHCIPHLPWDHKENNKEQEWRHYMRCKMCLSKVTFKSRRADKKNLQKHIRQEPSGEAQPPSVKWPHPREQHQVPDADTNFLLNT